MKHFCGNYFSILHFEIQRSHLYSSSVPYLRAHLLNIMTHFSALGDTFDENVPVLFGLEIPQFLRDIPVCNSSCQTLQRGSLVQFFSNTNGPRWLKKKSWNTTAFLCDWEGILCYNRTLHVIAIKLEGNNGMRGYVDDTIGQLPYLLGFNLGGNGLQGDVGKLLTTFKEFLIHFDFEFNELYGLFPSAISKTWKKLGKIQISGNGNIKGILTDDICLLQDLQVLSLGETGITGFIPSCISKLSKIYFLDFETLSLFGKLSYLRGLSKLKWIHLMSNRIDGEIPQEFGSWFPDLQELLLQGNNLRGPVPASIGNLTSLSLLQLSKNKGITGLLPVTLSNLTRLEILDISYTSINGFEAGLMLQTTYLSSFVAKGNKNFAVSIYRLIEVLQKSKASLIQLDVGACDIRGKFDKINDDTNSVNGIFQFSKLAFLDLSSNKGLYGTIPDPINSINLLIFFNASFTNLSSALPVNYLIKLKVLQEIDVRGNLYMRGEINQRFITIDYTVMIKEKSSHKFACPTLSFKHNNGIILVDSSYYDRRHCQCLSGYFGLGGHCRECLKNGICHGGSNVTIASSKDYLFSNVTIPKGFWPYPHHNNVKQFLSCRWTLPGREVCNPSGSVHCFLKQFGNKFVTVCEGEICRRGSTGRLCSECERGFFKSKAHCQPCPKAQESRKLAIIITVAVIMIVLIGASLLLFLRRHKVLAIIFAIVQAVGTFILAIIGIIPSWLAQINIILFLITAAGFGKSCKVLMKIIVFYVQIVDSLITSAHIWPIAFYDFADFLGNTINLKFSVLKCEQPSLLNPLGQLILLMTLPLLFVVLLGFLSLIPCNFVRHRWPNFRYKCSHLTIMFLNLSYFPLVKATASVLIPCQQVQEDSFMASFPWVDCPSPQYRLVKSLAVASLVIYVIGIPFLFLGLLIWKRNEIAEGNEITQDWLGSLFTSYKVKHRVFMEFLLMMRRTALAFLSAFFADDIPLQLGLISVVFLVYLTYESQARPFLPTYHHAVSCDRTPQGCTCLGLENFLELTMLVILFVSFVAVKSSVIEKQVSEPLIWMIGLVNALFGLVLASSFISRLLKREPGEDAHHEIDALIPQEE